MTVRVYIPVVSGTHVGQEYPYEGNLYELIDHQFDLSEYDEKTVPVAIQVNGRVVRMPAWKSTNVDNFDDVGIYVLQHGGIFKGLGSLLGGIFKVVFGVFGLGARSGGYHRATTQQGQAAEALDLRANSPRIGATVPEVAGRIISRPDMLNEPRKLWTTQRNQSLYMLLAVSVGKVHLGERDVLVGSTPMADLGENAKWKLYLPGEDLSAEPAAQIWYHSDEVGGTSSGQAGLELPADADTANNTNPSDGYLFDGLTITRSSGSWPSGWAVNHTTVTIVYPRVYIREIETIFEQEHTTYRNTYEGYFGHVDISMLPPKQGGELGDYFPLVIEDKCDGIYKIGYRRSGNGSWFSGDNAGSYTASYDTVGAWSINSITGNSIALSPVGVYKFQNNTQVSGSRVVFSSGVVGEWTGKYVCTPFGETSRNVEFDIFFPRGLGRLGDSGGIQSYTAIIEFQIEDILTGQIYSMVKSYTASTNDQIGFTEKFTAPDGWRFQCRMRRIGAKSTDIQVLDDVQWTALRSRMRDLNKYENWSVLAIEYSQGGKISAQSENQVTTLPTRILPELNHDGTWSPEKPTRQIAAMYRYIANVNGYDDSQIGLDELLRLQNQYWTPRGDTFDHVIDATTTKAALNMALGAGMAEYTVSGDMLRPVRKGVRTAFEQGYSPLNIIGNVQHEIKPHAHDDYDGLIVEYMDERTWEKEQVKCYLPSDIGKKTTTIKADGIVDRARAYQYGMRKRCEQEYQRHTFSFQTAAEGMNSNYASYIPIIDTLRDYGQAALLEMSANVNGTAYFTVTESFIHEDGKQYSLAYRDHKGNVRGAYSVISIDGKNIQALIPESEMPIRKMHQEPIHIYFGESNRWAYEALVDEVSPSDGIYCKISAVNYDPRVYQYDDALPPEED